MIFGWDVSTAIIGFAAMDDTGHLIHVDHCDLRKIDGLNEKGDIAQRFVRMIWDKYGSSCNRSVHFVEDRLAGFSGGGSNAGTIMRLAAFNAMVCWFIHDTWMEDLSSIMMMHPSTVKAMMKQQGLCIPKGANKKKLTLKYVIAREREHFPLVLNKKGNPQPYCFDRADACITAWAGFRKFNPCKQL